MLPMMSASCLFSLNILTAFIIFLQFDWPFFASLFCILAMHMIYSLLIVKILQLFFPIIEGRFKCKSPEFYRWQAQALIFLLSAIYFEPIVPFIFRNSFYRFFGAKIGKNCGVGGKLVDVSLIVIEDDVLIGADSMILGHLQTKHEVIIGRVHISAGATVGAKSLISPGVTLESESTVGAMSMVSSFKTVPKDETWVGIPAKRLEKKSV